MSTIPAQAKTATEEQWLIESLRNGDEAAFALLLERYQVALTRLARMYVSSREVAEEVAQETWLGVLQGLDRFEGRSSLKTWIFTILINCAKTRGQRESRSIPFSAMWNGDAEPYEPAADPERFLPPDHPETPRHWVSFPNNWDTIPEEYLLAQETRAYIEDAIETLAPNQRAVITLRDVEGWTSSEVCNVLGISETHQRVLLHRARSKVRRALEKYFDGKRPSARTT
ncbi:MAG: sigma-70 family RNA polymerase sigma factor [Chloroflexi bacterium]|nr:sigma-70 family RNA polymerase sigma factor [Chloroflexota bacterium]